MKISIITATFNSENFILTNLDSIIKQKHSDYEHIIIDNKSRDNTLEIIKQKGINIKIISERDDGVYDAFNKGIKISDGEIISILNSDDFYYDENILEKINQIFEENDVDIVYGDLKYVKRSDINNIIRFWKSGTYKENYFYKGWSPPHPSFFVKKSVYDKFGLYKKEYGNSADFELMFRFLDNHNLKSYYLNKTLVTMRTGGKSNNNLVGIINQNIIILDILGIKKNIYSILKFVTFKFFYRVKQFIFLK